MKIRNCLAPVIALILIVIFAVCIQSHAGEVRGVTKDTIKIGDINDMTGPVTILTLPYIEAQRNYFRWVNENGGIHGRKIKLIVEDDRYSIPMAVAAFKKLAYRDKVLCIIGPAGTGQHTALFSQLEKMKIPSFAINISETMWVPYKRYVFPPAGDYHDFIGVAYDYIMKNLKVKDPRIAIVRPDTEGGKICHAGAEKMADLYNVKLYEEILAVGSMDASSQMLNLKRRGVNNIIISALTTGESALVMKNGKRFGFYPNVFGVHYACGDEAIGLAGEAAKNYYGIHAYSTWYEDVPEMKNLRDVTMKYHPGTKPRIMLYQQGWYWGKIISEGLKRAGKDLDAEKLVDALEGFKDFDTGGICGPVTYTSKSHKATNYCKIFNVNMKKRMLLPVTGWMKPGE